MCRKIFRFGFFLIKQYPNTENKAMEEKMDCFCSLKDRLLRVDECKKSEENRRIKITDHNKS